MNAPRWILLVLTPALGGLGLWYALARRGSPGTEACSTPAPPPVAVELGRDPLPPPALASPQAPQTPAASGGGDGSGARRPDPWVALNNEATGALAQGDLEGAVERFERCVAGAPGQAIYAANLAEALIRLARHEYDQDRLAAAIGHLQRALELADGREDIEALRALLARWQRELELESDDWTDDSQRFELSFDTDRLDLLHHSHEVLEHLERSYDELVRWFGEDPFPAGRRIRVVLYEPEDFDRLTGLGDWAGGLFDGVVRVSVRDLLGGQDWRPVLTHELVHAFVQELGGSTVPGWLNEGLAQLLEDRPEALQRLSTRLEGQPLFSLEELSGSLISWQDTAAIGRAYAQSLLFVEHLRRTFGDEALRRMVGARRSGGTPASAFEAWSAIPLELAFQDWAQARSR